MRTSSVCASLLRRAALQLLPVVLGCQAGVASAYDLSYLRSLLDATPVGGWVKANTSTYGSVVVPDFPDQSYTNPASVVLPWSSMAWDTKRGQLYIWGGGHANYIGNEMHVWNGATGTWSLGSLPSRITNVTGAGIDSRTWVVVDGAAPQSAHTFDGNLYLPVNDYFLTFGDAVFDTGNGFQRLDGAGNLVKAGPWLWDPIKADRSKVGGTTGSGYNPTVQGGNMWVDRQGQWAAGTDGAPTSNFLTNASAYRNENGKDVVYVTKRGTSSGMPDLFRYTLGDVRNGGQDTWELVGVSWFVGSGESTAVIDQANNLFVHTSVTAYDPTFELQIWDLGRAGADNRDIGVHLVLADGSDLRLGAGAGMAYNETDGTIWLWDGNERGTVYRTKASFNADGSLSNTWIAQRFLSVTSDQPQGNFFAGVFGKWQYVAELGAFIAMDEYSAATGDAGVWLYKPMAAAVPEVNGVWLMMAGLGSLVMLRSRRRAKA